MKWCDSHAHLTSPEILPILDAVLARAKAAGIEHMINICTDRESLKAGVQRKLLNAGATTPHDVEKDGEAEFPIFEQAARAKNLVAIGETGLDYHYQHSDRKVQQKFLIRYLHLAASLQLPVIFHCREAFDDLFSIVDAEYPKNGPAILHCFTGTQKEAERVLERGWHLSISGIVTFKKSEALREVVKHVPLSQLLIETDAPYLAPQTKRGQQNEPAFLPETGLAIAIAKGLSVEAIARATSENVIRLFQLSK